MDARRQGSLGAILPSWKLAAIGSAGPGFKSQPCHSEVEWSTASQLISEPQFPLIVKKNGGY